ncbi:MAG: hypothetical protein Q9159_000914 [Coniocarpon cinnabarinum]
MGTRDRQIHGIRRRLWESALDAKSRVEYINRIHDHVQKLDDRISTYAKSGETVLINDLFSWFTFDIMGLFAFGHTFDMLNSGKWHPAVLGLRRGTNALAILSCVPWLARVGFAYLPGFWIVKDWFNMTRFCEERIMARATQKDKMDIASHFIKEARANGFTKEDKQWLSGDALIVIVAGSDTTSATLIFLFYQLARNPDTAERLYQELEGLDITDVTALQQLPMLNGVISETLRLHPATPSAVYRETSQKGMVVGDTFIPGGTKIVAPRWTISRLESCFEDANSFVPERWFSKPEMVRKRIAYSPFAFGRWSCAGKLLALDEIRYVVSHLVQRYRVRFASGDGGASVERDMKDHVVAVPGPLRLQFERRYASTVPDVN